MTRLTQLGKIVSWRSGDEKTKLPNRRVVATIDLAQFRVWRSHLRSKEPVGQAVFATERGYFQSARDCQSEGKPIAESGTSG